MRKMGQSMAELIHILSQDANQKKGEFVLVVEGAEQTATAIDAQAETTMRVLMEELPLKQAAAIGAKLMGLKKRDLYQWGLEHGKHK